MIGSDFDTPIMYQDLANSTMGPLNLPFGNCCPGLYNTSYLGGIKMQPQLDRDKFSVLEQKEKEDKSTMKKALIALGIIAASWCVLGFCRNVKKAGGPWQYIKNQWTKLKNVFTKKSSATP